MNAPARSTTESQFNRVPLIIALVLALALVVGVLVGAKMMLNNYAQQQIQLGAASAPDADSAECRQLVDALPNKARGLARATLADPSPAGTAAYTSGPGKQITVRCGVEAPLQYTDLSELHSVSGTQWLRIKDTTPNSDRETWFAVGSSPIVAVTAEGIELPKETGPVGGFEDAVSTLHADPAATNPWPLADMSTPGVDKCTALMRALPEELGNDYRRTDEPLPAGTAAWVADGWEPIVLRCGVNDAPGYQPGAQLIQVGKVPWFEDTTLANGTTAGTYFALGRDVNVAVSMPDTVGNSAIASFSSAIERSTAES